MVSRIGDLGFSPNRTAALGLNLVLLVNLAGTAWLSTRFLSRHGSYNRLERWQTGYLPVFALWAATVVVILPWLFDFA
jgi:lipopolysaccharide export LptBFGC system permease protein LptF